MKNFQLVLVLFAFCYSSGYSQDSSMNMQMSDTGATHVMMNKNDVKWMDAPPGLPAGAKFAILAGDPSTEGPFTLRVTFPANYKVPPHWHPTAENVSVLEGTFYMGSGEQMDQTAAKPLTTGGFASIPAKSAHYAFTKSKCIVQVHGTGPFAITYINPSDDPRNKQ